MLADNNESIIDTGFIIKRIYRNKRNEDTGEYNTDYMFSKLIDLSHGY